MTILKKITFVGIAFAVLIGTFAVTLRTPISENSPSTPPATTSPEVKPREIEVKLQSRSPEITPTPNITLLVSSTSYSVHTEASTTVLEVMQALASTPNFTFTGREYTSLGFFIESINEKRSGYGLVWIFYVNGIKSGEGVSSARVSPHDVIEWRYEKSY